MRAYCFSPDPWQELVLNAWCAVEDDGSPLYTTNVLDVPRQNGKNGVCEGWEFQAMVLGGEKILHTAHQVKTAAKSFKRLCSFFEDKRHKRICNMVECIRRTNGEQGIYLKNGGLIEYSARSRGASRGNTYSTVVYDEAQELTDDQVEALMSTIAASPTGYRKLIYMGTPPGPNSPGTVYQRVRKAAITNPSPRTCLHEWGIGEFLSSERFEDLLDAVYEANPAMGIRLDEEFTQEEWRTMTPDGFARERLGWWSEQTAQSAIKQSLWASCAVDERRAEGEGVKTYGVKFTPDGERVAVVACRLDPAGSAYIELVCLASTESGVRWVAEMLCDEERAERTAAVAVDGKSGKDALLDKLRGEYPRQALPKVGPAEVVASTTMLVDALKEGALSHWAHDTQSLLDESACKSVKRPVGDGGGWAFGGDESAPMEAACLAYWAAKTTKRDPEGGCVIL